MKIPKQIRIKAQIVKIHGKLYFDEKAMINELEYKFKKLSEGLDRNQQD